jgi:UDP-glucose 4-epimerase
MNGTEAVLVTGGGGFIGSHTCVSLVERGCDVVVVDDHSTSSPLAVERIRQLTGVSIPAYSLDIADRTTVAELMRGHHVTAVIHFAARKAVGESTQIPLEYFNVNIGGTTSLLRAMHDAGVRRLVFSSSCSIYGDNEGVVFNEVAPPRPTNPYAWSKWTCEQMISQAVRYHPEMQAISLRYFNPIGAHPSGVLGEDPTDVPKNIVPYLAQVAVGRLEKLSIFGDDYPTSDGTAIRDYIHVMDIADGHVVALDHFHDSADMQIVNLGTGIGTSVLELRSTFVRACGRDIPYVVRPRRQGDVAKLVADTRWVQDHWGWRPRFGLERMCADAWNFQMKNPDGYQTVAAVS